MSKVHFLLILSILFTTNLRASTPPNLQLAMDVIENGKSITGDLLYHSYFRVYDRTECLARANAAVVTFVQIGELENAKALSALIARFQNDISNQREEDFEKSLFEINGRIDEINANEKSMQEKEALALERMREDLKKTFKSKQEWMQSSQNFRGEIERLRKQVHERSEKLDKATANLASLKQIDQERFQYKTELTSTQGELSDTKDKLNVLQQKFDQASAELTKIKSSSQTETRKVRAQEAQILKTAAKRIGALEAENKNLKAANDELTLKLAHPPQSPSWWKRTQSAVNDWADGAWTSVKKLIP